MGYGSGGKNWNLGLSDHGRLGATQRQYWQLRKLTGEDHRGRGYTQSKASELISAAMRDRQSRKEGLTGVAEKIFDALFSKALDEANKAGDQWMEAHPKPLYGILDPESGQKIDVHGTIGTAWITWPKSNSDFHKWLIENLYDGKKKMVPVPHKYTSRIEGELLLACEKAAFEVLKKSATSIGDIRLMYRCEDPHLDQAA